MLRSQSLSLSIGRRKDKGAAWSYTGCGRIYKAAAPVILLSGPVTVWVALNLESQATSW